MTVSISIVLGRLHRAMCNCRLVHVQLTKMMSIFVLPGGELMGLGLLGETATTHHTSMFCGQPAHDSD